MLTSRRVLYGLALFAALLQFAAAASAADPKVEPLWPNGAPNAAGNEDADKPTLTFWLAPADKANGCAVVICPGGGYGGLATDHEGKQVAEWLNTLGVTGVMLKYRHAPKYRHPTPLQDAQRAIRTVRARAEELNVDPNRIGILGFSAGGHLASTVATHFDDGQADASDPIEKQSSRPTFAVLCYPVISLTTPYTHVGSKNNLLGKEPDQKLVESLSNELQVTEKTPPTFLFHTSEDTAVPPENSILFYSALRKAKVPAELHIYEKGVHGVGLAQKDPILSTWPARCADWLKLHGWLDKPKLVAADPAKVVDPDFAVQGEYSGEIRTEGGMQKIGVQIIAKGKGKFHAVGYIGGLPGDGWDGSEKHEADGERKGDAVVFLGNEAIASIRDGVMSVLGQGDAALGKLTKTVRNSPTFGLKAPAGAIVLFDGKNGEPFEGARVTPDGMLMQGVTSKQKFQSGTLHLEFRTPYQPEHDGQQRGNSGCYLQGRYEVQILDSFGLAGRDNECGGIYSVKNPDLNMCFPPLTWQTYDIDFTAATFGSDGKPTKPARITVRHNGVLVHNDIELPNRNTTGAPVAFGSEPGPVYLQDHGNPVRFQNVWFVEKK